MAYHVSQLSLIMLTNTNYHM